MWTAIVAMLKFNLLLLGTLLVIGGTLHLSFLAYLDPWLFRSVLSHPLETSIENSNIDNTLQVRNLKA